MSELDRLRMSCKSAELDYQLALEGCASALSALYLDHTEDTRLRAGEALSERQAAATARSRAHSALADRITVLDAL